MDPMTARAAVSARSVDLVTGDVTSGRILGVFAQGCYLDIDGVVLPVLGPAAYRLPTAVMVPVPPTPWGTLRRGEACLVGDGEIRLGDWLLTMTRIWQPSRVRRMPGPPIPRGLLEDLARSLGSGPGLTPEADDVLAGALLVAAARGGVSQRAEVVAAAYARTTALSAALIEAAFDGFAVPEAVAYVDAILVGDPRATRLRQRLEGFGHSSGKALIRGVELAARALTLDQGAASA